MASSLIGWLLVAAVSLLGICVSLWISGGKDILTGFNSADNHPGEKPYNLYCAACHGQQGEGNPALGAPNLSNDIWLYGGSI